MGMLVKGKWDDAADTTMISGEYTRAPSQIDQEIPSTVLQDINSGAQRYILVASNSCPWSHRTLLVRAVKSLQACLPVHFAGGPRTEGYGLVSKGPLRLSGQTPKHMHQLYTASIPNYTGRVTVPVLWDSMQAQIISNESAHIMRGLDRLEDAAFTLTPPHLAAAMEALNTSIHTGLANAVYRAGLAQSQDAYDAAVHDVFGTLDRLENNLAVSRFLFGQTLTETDLRLFATLVRFDTVYATHFRCTRKRLVEYPKLWAYARDIYALPGVADTVDFAVIQEGYYLNDGVNPHGILPEIPQVDWSEPTERQSFGDVMVWGADGNINLNKAREG